MQHAILQGGIDTQAVENPGHGFGRDIQCSVMRCRGTSSTRFFRQSPCCGRLRLDNIAGVEIVHQLQRPLHRVFDAEDIHALFKPGA